MNRTDVQDWLDRYIVAWRRNEPGSIEALFTEDAVYRFRPYGGPGRIVRGIAEIVDAWIDESDDAEGWEASYQAFAADGDRAVATGISRYYATESDPESVYHNCFLLRFASDGRCAEFTEYWMLEPREGTPG
jgi:hypothetical protein